MEENNSAEIEPKNSPAGEFLQSEVWQSFQESVGRKTFHLSGENFWANVAEHRLPLVGKYFYIPRGPKISDQESVNSEPAYAKASAGKQAMEKLIRLAKENGSGWIRIEPETEELLENIRKNTKYKIQKAPHDMQPKETFVIDIAKSEEELLAEMKPKTRYNIKLSQKHDVLVKVISNDKIQISNQIQNSNDKKSNQYIEEFLRLTAVMAKRQGITAHPAGYYRQMLQNISRDILKLYVAEYQGEVIAANLVVFFGDTCTYLHGASDDNFRNVMAPYLLQWQQIQDAKKAGCVKYDFGGIKTGISDQESVNKKNLNSKGQDKKSSIPNTKYQILDTKWGGITKFKTGFSPKTFPTVRPGSYDIVISPKKYWLYRTIQKIKELIKF